MDGGQPWQYILGTFVTLVLGYLTYRGGTIQAEKSREGVARTADVSEQESALQAWQAMNEPLMKRVDWLEGRMKSTEARHEKERLDFQSQIREMTENIEKQANQLRHWKSLARVIARWATTLRDEVLRLGGTLPAEPEELLTLQAIIDADAESDA